MPQVFFTDYLDKLHHEKKDGVVCNPVLNKDKKAKHISALPKYQTTRKNTPQTINIENSLKCYLFGVTDSISISGNDIEISTFCTYHIEFIIFQIWLILGTITCRCF